MTTEQPAMTAFQVEDRLEQIAPYPAWGKNVTAEGVARYLAVRAQLGFARNVTPFIRDDQEVSPMLVCACFAAAHALIALAETAPEAADEAARRIVDAWVDGNCLGAYLHDDLTTLSVDPSEVSRLDEARLAAANTARARAGEEAT
jgi:hypothetical protein